MLGRIPLHPLLQRPPNAGTSKVDSSPAFSAANGDEGATTTEEGGGGKARTTLQDCVYPDSLRRWATSQTQGHMILQQKVFLYVCVNVLCFHNIWQDLSARCHTPGSHLCFLVPLYSLVCLCFLNAWVTGRAGLVR